MFFAWSGRGPCAKTPPSRGSLTSIRRFGWFGLGLGGLECSTTVQRDFLGDLGPYRLGQHRVEDSVLQAALERKL